MKMTKTEKLFRHLYRFEEYSTVAELKRATRLKDIPSAVRRLRKKGVCVYTFRDDNKTYYWLGRPTPEMVKTAMAAYGAKIFQR